MARSAEERLAELQEKRKREEARLAKLKEQERDLLNAQKAQERKARTHRLILIGAAVENALGRAVNTADGEEKELAEIIVARQNGTVSESAFEGVMEEILGRKLSGSDIAKFSAFLKFQEDRGRYFTRWLNKATEK